MIGTIRARFGPTRRRASATKLRTPFLQPRPRADEVERGTGGAGVVARRRAELAGLDRRDRRRQLRLQRRAGLRRRTTCSTSSSGRSRNWYTTSTSSAPAREARERVHEPLEPVLALDDLGRRRVLEHVRLVVEDERAAVGFVEHVHPAAQKHAVVLERERALDRRTGQRRDPPGEPRPAVVLDEAADRAPARRRSPSDSAPAPPLPGRRAARGEARSSPSRRTCTASPISVAARPPSPGPAGRRASHAARRSARRRSGTSNARRGRGRCTRASARGSAAAPAAARGRAAWARR